MELSIKEYDYLTKERLFYKGVIENNKDPLEAGRYQVRLLGIDTEDKSLLPTSALPWAISLNTTGLIGGIGLSTTYNNGTWVYCFLEDGDRQRVVILGSIPGNYDSKPDSSYGFSDPSGTHPLSLNDYHSESKGDSYTKSLVYATPNGHMLSINDAKQEIKIHHSSGSEILIGNDGTITITGVKDTNITNTNNFHVKANQITLESSVNTMII
jgi:hypothetical protein